MSAANYSEVTPVRRYYNSEWLEVEDDVLVELPVSLIYNGYPHVVIMCTPKDIIDFVYGFSLTEGIVSTLQDVRSIEVLSLIHI